MIRKMALVGMLVIAMVLVGESQARPGSGVNRKSVIQRAASHKGLLNVVHRLATSSDEDLIKAVADYVGKQASMAKNIASIAKDMKSLILATIGNSKNGIGGVRLVNGSNKFEGRLEVFHDGVWGSVCDDFFANKEAKVVCRTLGFKGGNYRPSAHFGKSTEIVSVYTFTCTGSEPSIRDCQVAYLNEQCKHYEDVGVVCEAPDLAAYNGRITP